VLSFAGTGVASGTFAGKTTVRGVPFTGTVTNGAFTVHLGTTTYSVKPDSNSVVDGDNACRMSG